MAMNSKWAGRFIDMAFLVASWSRDPSSQVGAVIIRGKRIVSLGFNGFPAGTDDSQNLYEDRDRKYLRVVHAEKNAILFAKQDLTGCTLYATHFPCCQCAAFIIQAGINCVVVPQQTVEFMGRWKYHIRESLNMFHEAKVKSFTYNKKEKTITNFLYFDPENIEEY